MLELTRSLLGAECSVYVRTLPRAELVTYSVFFTTIALTDAAYGVLNTFLEKELDVEMPLLAALLTITDS